MSDGATFDVRHPEMAMVGAVTLIVAKEVGEEGLPTRFAYLDPLHVTRLEPLNGATNR